MSVLILFYWNLWGEYIFAVVHFNAHTWHVGARFRPGPLLFSLPRNKKKTRIYYF